VTVTETGSPYVVRVHSVWVTGSSILVDSCASVCSVNLLGDPHASLSIDGPGLPGGRVAVKAVQATLFFPSRHEPEWIEANRRIETTAGS